MAARRSMAAAALLALAAAASRADTRCAKWVVVDGLADPGNGQPGAVLDVSTTLPPTQNAQVTGGIGQSAFLAGIATGPGRAVFLSDIEADPSGLGPDANGHPGPGAVFRLDAAGDLVVVSDGATCGPSIPACPPGGTFVDPLGIAFDRGTLTLLIADLDADPSGLGADSHGFAGHGALLRVDPATGVVDLVADGSRYAGTIPRGAPSIFEDPVAVTVARDGTIYVVDQLAVPLYDQGLPNPGAVFRVDPATGVVSTVAVIPRSAGLRDVAVEPAGTLLVLDRIAGGGTITRVDPAGLPPPQNVLGSFPIPDFVDAQGLVVEGDGTIAIVDASADPLGDSSGALFTIDPAFGAVSVASAPPLFRAPWGVDLYESESLDGAAPNGAPPGSVTVRLRGGLFDADATVSFGPAITVDAVRVLDPWTIDADITIPPGTPAQSVDVTVGNPTVRTMAFHCELFDVLPGTGCAPTQAVGDSLRVSRGAGDGLVLAWDGAPDACRAIFRVRRAFTARPSVPPGAWPSDPAFTDVTSQDGDGSASDARFTCGATANPLECFVVTAVGSDGSEGPADCYGG